MTPPIDAATLRRLLRHEAEVHAIPGRELRDLGDSLLLHDAIDPEPFWSRLEGICWPSEPSAFDRRLGEVGILFASIGRQPHIWLAPPHDEPDDLEARLLANGFEDMGKGLLLIARADDQAREALAVAPSSDTAIERLSRIEGRAAVVAIDRPRFRKRKTKLQKPVKNPPNTGCDRILVVPLYPQCAAEAAADAIVGVLFDAFGVGEARRAGIVGETVATLADARFTHYLVRRGGEPVAVARRATFGGLSYLSSIGTVDRARGQGFGRLVTATALVDAIEAGSEWVHLGVFADNPGAIALYERLGFVAGMDPGPDMVLVG